MNDGRANPGKSPIKLKINLAGSFRESFEQIFFKWAVNIGRIIIVVTELIALSALLYRFVIDRQIIDLHEDIDREYAFLKSQENKEKEYRGIQGRLSYIKTISAESQEKVTFVNDLVELLKTGAFSATNIALKQSKINVDGKASSVFSLNTLIENLKTKEAVEAIALGDITSVDDGIEFTLNIELKTSVLPE